MIRNQEKGDSCRDIDHGMLLQKYRGQTDSQRKKNHGKFTNIWYRSAVQHGSQSPKGTDHMFRRADVCVGIQLVQNCCGTGQEIVPGVCSRTQILTAWKGQKEQGREGEGKDQIPAVPEKHIGIRFQRIQMDPHNQNVPEHIENEKTFLKGDPAVQRTENLHSARFGTICFQQTIAQGKKPPKQGGEEAMIEF